MVYTRHMLPQVGPRRHQESEMVVAQRYGVEGFTVSQVMAIKRALIGGAHVTALARWYKCSAETIRRIKRGETYNHIEVEGEECLRPPIALMEFNPGDGTREPLPLPAGRRAMSDEQAEAETRRMEIAMGLRKPDEPEAVALVEVTPPKPAGSGGAEVSPEVREQASKFL